MNNGPFTLLAQNADSLVFWSLPLPQFTMVPAPPAAARPGDVVGVSFQNAGAGALGAGVATFGQAFVRGDVPAGTGQLSARLPGGESLAVQMDVKTRHADGSVKFAVLSVERPEIAPGQSLGLVLSTGPATVPAPAPVGLATALAGRSFQVDIIGAPGSPSASVDVLARLQQGIADGTASVWQSGPLATQARVAVDLPGSQRLLFDVTVFRDGEFKVNAQFNNDEAMGATGGRVNHTAVARLDGVEVFRKTVSQAQYQNWRETFSSDETNGGQLTGDPSQGWLNIRHDLGYLSKSGAVARYDTQLGIREDVLAGWQNQMATTPGWGEPLANNGIRQAMGDVGGREDIGITTAGNTAWLMSGDVRAARFALDQAEVSGAAPWNTWDVGNRTWLNTDHYPRLWTDPRGGTGRPGDPTSTGLTQQKPTDTGWGVTRSHQPDLSFVPYLLTGERMHLDALQAQASFSIMFQWPIPRGNDADILVANGNQLRSSAWSLRQVEHAAWSSPDGSPEQAYFGRVAADNWKLLVSRIPEWRAAQGEAFGWVPDQDNRSGGITQFGQDYFASTAFAAAARGNADARTFVTEFMSNYLIGRFGNADRGWNPRDGVAYVILTGPTDGSHSVLGGTITNAFKTWAQMGAATLAGGFSNGATGWAASNGEYGRLGMASLAGLYHLTGNPAALAAYRWIAAENPHNTQPEHFALRPNYAVTIPGVYGGTILGTAGNDFVAPGSGSTALVADLGAGFDTLHLGAGGNIGSVRNVEVLRGGAGNDTIRLEAAPGVGTVVDMGAGTDRLTLGDGGNLVTLRNAEALTGGAGDDTVILSAPTAGMSVDLGAGFDRIALAGGGNTIRVANAEAVTGGAGNDAVTLATAFSGRIDLGAGADTLTLTGASNTIALRNVETLTGGGGEDRVTFETGLSGGVVDLGSAHDILVLADGGNVLRVTGVEDLRGGAGNDVVTLGGATNVVVDLGGGVDRLVLANAPNSLTVGGVETLLGGTGNDTVVFSTAGIGLRAELGAGFDRLTLADGGPNGIAVRGVETLFGGSGEDTVTFLDAVAATQVIDLRGGADHVVLGNFANSARLSGVERVTGGTANDTVVLLTPILDGLVNLGAGVDRLELSFSAANRLTVRNVETVLGGSGEDTLTVANAMAGGVINLGNGNDRLILADGGNTITVGNVEAIQGGSGSDFLLLSAATFGAVVDLGAGTDRLTLSHFNNQVTVLGVEAVASGNGADVVTFASAAVAGTQVSLGHGLDRLVLGDFVNSVVVAGAETILGGALADTVALTAANPAGLVVDLGAGHDRLNLSTHGGAVSVRNVELVVGSLGLDTVTVLAPVAGGYRVDLGGGADRLVMTGAGGHVATVLNTEQIVGGAGNDVVTLGSPATGITVDLNGGDDRLVLANGPNTLSVGHVETLTGGTGNDTVTLTAATLAMTFDGGAGTDRITLFAGTNAVTLRQVELAVGGLGNDRITNLGTNGMRIEGGAGFDTLVGNTGADVLFGGAGADTLTGGGGVDRFLYTARDQGGDVITDFDGAGDLLVFQGMLRGSFDFRGAGAFLVDGQSQARFVEATRQMQVDVDGNGATDIAITLQGVALAQLSAADFLWM